MTFNTKAIALLLCVLLPLNSFAEGLQYVPKWTMVGDRACYDLEGAKKLLQVDADMAFCFNQRNSLLDMAKELKLTIEAKDRVISNLNIEVATLKDENTKIVAMLNTCTVDKNRCVASKSDVSFGWFVAGGVVIAAAALVGGILLGNYVLGK